MKIIGLDIGTTSICGICCDTCSGNIVKSITRENDSFINTENSFEKLQDPNRILAIIMEIYYQLISEFPDVESIGVTGQMHGIVYLNNEGKAISPLTIWQDGRGDLPYKDGLFYAEWLSKKTGYKLSTGFGGVTHFYNTVNGLIPKEAVTFCTIHDLAVLTLTGQTKPYIHSSNAASFGFFDLEKLDFDYSNIQMVGMDKSFFPTVCEEYKIVGKTKENIPVTIAIGDNQASVLGAVSDLENSLLVNVGTGSQISIVVDKPFSASGIECRPLIENKYLLVGSSLCGGRAYAILEKFLRQTASIISGCEIKSAYPIMDKLTENEDFENNTLIVDTKFSGTRENPEERGKIEGISTDNFTVANLCDGFMNGMVNELSILFKQMNVCRSILVGSGNGIRLNNALKKRFEKEFSNKMLVPLQCEEAAFGASLYGMVASGFAENIKTAQKLIKY